MQNETSGVSPLRADVRLVPAHALITDDVSWVKSGCTCDSTAKGYMKKKKGLKLSKKKTLISDLKKTQREIASFGTRRRAAPAISNAAAAGPAA